MLHPHTHTEIWHEVCFQRQLLSFTLQTDTATTPASRTAMLSDSFHLNVPHLCSYVSVVCLDLNAALLVNLTFNSLVEHSLLNITSSIVYIGHTHHSVYIVFIIYSSTTLVLFGLFEGLLCILVSFSYASTFSAMLNGVRFLVCAHVLGQ